MVDVIIQRTVVGYFNIKSEFGVFNVSYEKLNEIFADDEQLYVNKKLFRATIEISQERFKAIGGVL